MKHTTHRARVAGFSLVEVMVAVVVICVGLLGIAKMQALSLSNTTTSRQRALAALQAASIASAMHANRQYWAGGTVGAGTFDLTITAGSPNTTVSVSGDPALQTAILQWNTTACIASAGGGAVCNPMQLAAFDVTRWWLTSINPMLPNASANINCPLVPPGTQAPISCTVRIFWSEKAVAMNKDAANVTATEQFERPTYTLYVQP